MISNIAWIDQHGRHWLLYAVVTPQISFSCTYNIKIRAGKNNLLFASKYSSEKLPDEKPSALAKLVGTLS